MISSANSPCLPHAVDTTTAGGRTLSGQTENLPEKEGSGFDFMKFAETCGAMNLPFISTGSTGFQDI